MKDIFQQYKSIQLPELDSSRLLVVSAIGTLLYTIIGNPFITAIGVGVSLFIFLRLLMQMNRTLPVLEIMLTMAAFQWIIGPIIDYKTPTTHYKYYMYVDEITYMSIVVPGFILFMIGAISRSKNLTINLLPIKNAVTKTPSMPFLFIIGGIIFDFIKPAMPGALQFFFFLLGNLKYIGIIMLMFSENTDKWWWLGGALLLTFISSMRHAMFHEFVLWSILSFCIISVILQLKIRTKLLLFFVAIIALSLLQTIKLAYREKVWDESYTGNRTELLLNLASEQDVMGNLSNDFKINEMNARLNQGWIISKIIENYQNKPYEGGTTIKEAITSSLVPRFLNPNKKGAGGKENFEKFTGLELGYGVSMGPSILGEFYGNYGKAGMWAAMFIWGLLVNLFFKYSNKLQDRVPTIMLFLPIIFFQVVKAETDLITVLNHLLKSSVVVFLVIWGGKRIMKLSL